jgi:recombination protein RecT
MSNTQVATLQEPPVERALVAMEEKFAAALPAHIPAERFLRVALSALTRPEIAKCAGSAGGRKSIYDACLKAASDGLLLDGREAALVPYGEGVQYQPMVAGIMKKARNSGEITSIVAQVVYSNDEFLIDYVTDGPPITHRPFLDGPRGDIRGVYAVARLKDGSWTQPEFMSRDEVEHVRKTFSKQPNSLMWTKAWGEGARKTVIRKAAKYWPSSTDKDGVDLRELIDQGEAPLDIENVTPTTPALKERSAARLLEATPDHDPQTGEVIERAQDGADTSDDV